MGGSNDLRNENRRERSDGGTSDFDKRRNANNYFILAHASRDLAASRRAGRKSLIRRQLQPESGTIFPLAADSHLGRRTFEPYSDDCLGRR